MKNFISTFVFLFVTLGNELASTSYAQEPDCDININVNDFQAAATCQLCPQGALVGDSLITVPSLGPIPSFTVTCGCAQIVGNLNIFDSRSCDTFRSLVFTPQTDCDCVEPAPTKAPTKAPTPAPTKGPTVGKKGADPPTVGKKGTDPPTTGKKGTSMKDKRASLAGVETTDRDYGHRRL
jgi:hypothetical protein